MSKEDKKTIWLRMPIIKKDNPVSKGEKKACIWAEKAIKMKDNHRRTYKENKTKSWGRYQENKTRSI